MHKIPFARRQASRLRVLKFGAVALLAIFAALLGSVAVQGAVTHDVAPTVAMVPFLAIGGLLFRDADKGGSGGVAAEEQDECPAINGDTPEAKLQSAGGIITNLWGRLTKALGDLAKKTADYATLEGQFNSMKDTAENEKTEHDKTKGLLESEKTDHTKTKGDLDTAKKNVTRLESLCGVKGIDKDQVVASDSGKTTGSEKAQEYLSLKKQEAAGEVQRGTASKFYREHKKEIDGSK